MKDNAHNDATSLLEQVLTGAFSCCRLRHQVQTLDGNYAPIPCDKIILRQVLAEVYEEGLSRAREVWQRDKEHDTRDMGGMGTFWSSILRFWPASLATRI